MENIPGWLGKIHELRVPKGVVPFKTPSPGGNANIKIILTLAKSTLHLEGDLAECGVYRGGTIIPLGLYLAQISARKTVFGFDSFLGFGATVRDSTSFEDSHIRPCGMFIDTSYEIVQKKLSV
jgi:hypothetical protein